MYIQKTADKKSSDKKTTQDKIKLAAFSAMFAALVTVATAFVKFTTPLGYVHAGDSVVYLAASILPFPYGIIAAAIGGGLADLLAGFASWALPTAIIKALNASVFAVSAYYLRKKEINKIVTPANLIALIPASAVTVGGYFVADLLFGYGVAASSADMIPNAVQAAVAIPLYIAIGVGLDAAKFKDRFVPRTIKK